MSALNSIPRSAGLPLALIAQAIPKLTRHDLEHLTERLIDRLDEIDGDADEEDATNAEDDFILTPLALHFAGNGGGCEIADPGGCEHDGREEDEAF